MLTTSINLLERVQHRDDQGAWERFVALYSPFLLRWGRQAGLPSREAADFAQDVLVILLQELPRFRYEPNRGSFRGWLKTIVLRQTALRRRRWDPAAPTGEHFPEAVEEGRPADSTWDAEYRQYLVGRALELMRRDFEPNTWQACWEHIVSGRSAAEVGRDLGLSEGAVHVARFRVLRRLRQEMRGLLD